MKFLATLLIFLLTGCVKTDVIQAPDATPLAKKSFSEFQMIPDVANTLLHNGTEAFAKSNRIATRQGGIVYFTLVTDPGKPRVPLVRLVDPVSGAVVAENLIVVALEKRRPLGQPAFTQSWMATIPKNSPAGIIRFEGRFGDATGHFDLWNGFNSTSGAPENSQTLESVDNLSVPDGTIWKWDMNASDTSVLELVDNILQKIPVAERNRAWRVAREISYAANNKVLRGRWDGNYKDGKEPSFWSSSSQIAQVWSKSGERVKYGQCWVFASMTTSMLRSLGIPTRTMTNLNSAKEARNPGVADYLPGSNRCAGDERGVDPKSIALWNFHVWNEFFVSEEGKTIAYAVDPTPNRDGTLSKLAEPVRVDELK